MAQRHDEFLKLGGRLYAISADTAEQNAAMIEKLALPYPILADPGRDRAITPLGFADEKDPRQISRPGTVIVSPDGEISFRVSGRDFADRPDEEIILEALRNLNLEPTTQGSPAVGEAQPGEKAMALEGLLSYYRGAKFAVLALRSRYRELSEDFRDDAKAYAQMVDRYIEALSAVEDRSP
jgi:hypothetical protein